MNTTPDWLEPFVRLEDFNGDVEAYIARLFSINAKLKNANYASGVANELRGLRQ